MACDQNNEISYSFRYECSQVGKVLEEELAIFKIKLSFLADNLLQTQLKTADTIKSVLSDDRGFLFREDSQIDFVTRNVPWTFLSWSYR